MNLYECVGFYLHHIKTHDSNDPALWEEMSKDFAVDLNIYFRQLAMIVKNESPFVFNLYIPDEESFTQLCDFFNILADYPKEEIQLDKFSSGLEVYRNFYNRWIDDNRGEKWGEIYLKSSI